MEQKVRFARINGRIVPIRPKKEVIKKESIAQSVAAGAVKGAALRFGVVAASVGLLGLGAYKAGQLGKSSRLGAGLRAYSLTKAKLLSKYFPAQKVAINKFTLGLMKLGKKP